jgi:peroxygenase
VLQQHCDFFDTDHDGILWPVDTFTGFYKLGFGLILSVFAVFIIHANFSYPTLPSWIPDPFFRIHLKNIHKDKHGSDSGTYDNEGRFVPQKFEEIFSKYANGRDYVTIQDVFDLMKGQRCIADPIGWGGALFEWMATYIMLWPKDGRMMKEDIRGVYDGSIFYTIAARRSKEREIESS